MNQSHSPNPASVALMTCPHKSIPSPRSSQCHAPHGSPPQINSIAPIQLHAPMEYPHKSISSFTSSQCRTPMACPYKSVPSPWFSPAPPWRVPASVTPQWRAPTKQSHLPDPVVCPHDEVEFAIGALDHRSPLAPTSATSLWHQPKNSLSTLMSLAYGLLNDALQLVNELSSLAVVTFGE